MWPGWPPCRPVTPRPCSIVAVPADGTAAGEPGDLTAGMTACPDELVQVAGGPPVALFAEGLDTALYRLDPAGPSFRRVAGWTGRAAALSASDDATAIAVLASTAYAPPRCQRRPAGCPHPDQRYPPGTARRRLGHPGAAVLAGI